MVFVFCLLLVLCAALLCREILTLGQEKRAGKDVDALYKRFRRRAKGLLLLIFLFALTAYYDYFEASEFSGAREIVLYVGLVMIVLIWVLILASRDLKETAHEALRNKQELTLSSLADFERELLKAHEQKVRKNPDLQRIAPGVKSPKKNRRKKKRK